MFSDQWFYHQSTRDYVALFGSLFDKISVVRKNKGGAEVERFVVPIIYGPKEKYITSLVSNPDLNRETQITLPRMSFEIRGIAYDKERKQNSLLRLSKANTAISHHSQYMAVPYNLNFTLTIYARHTDDGNQIVEQILPFFNPDYTATIEPDAKLGIKRDIPIILDSVSSDIEYEGNSESTRLIFWTLNFTMKAYYYGPTSDAKIIRKVIANIYLDPSISQGNLIRLNVSNGNNGTFNEGDIVYQGDDYRNATAFAYVESFKPSLNYLTIGQPQGSFTVNTVINALSTNAKYTLASFDTSPLKVVKITIEPSPNTANPGDAFGYDETYLEWPDRRIEDDL